MRQPSRQAIGYVAILVVCFVLAMAAGWTTFGVQIDNDAYDFLFRLAPAEPRELSSVILAIDEETLRTMGGLRRLRAILAEGLEAAAAARPAVVVVDLILADEGDPAQDELLAAAFEKTDQLVLATDLVASGWEDPLPRFRRHASAVGHAHADPDPFDNVTRRVSLEKAAGAERRWALALEAFRLTRRAPYITESPAALEVAGLAIPAPRDEARPLHVRYLRRPPGAASAIPAIPLVRLRDDPAAAGQLRDKVVFVGITAQSASGDRHMTPYSAGQPMPGVEINAIAYETLARGEFLTPVSDSLVVLLCLLVTAAIGFTFHRLSGWPAYVIGSLVIVAVHALVYLAFRADAIFPFAAPFSTAWLSVVGAATYQHFVVRRQLDRSETARTRYQQAIHFVTHEMRSPLTAIQGSSELMGRYQLPEAKSKELAQMINAESKRLARMIQTFLDVERLSDGQTEIKREPFEVSRIVEACLMRVRPLAERKRIELRLGAIENSNLVGDRELMEYAVYNLLNNAVKYSPAETEVTVSSRIEGESVRLSVRDQGIGMDDKELRSIFKKFYRTKRAEASGEAGTGIGLSIVEQIVTHHGGRMEVASKPGQGSCFTMVLPVAVPMAAERGAEQTEQR